MNGAAANLPFQDIEIPTSEDVSTNNLNIILPIVICGLLILSIIITTFLHRTQELDILRVALERNRRRSSNDADTSNNVKRSSSSSQEGLNSTNNTDLTSESSSGFQSRNSRRKSLPSYVESIEQFREHGGHIGVTRSLSSSD